MLQSARLLQGLFFMARDLLLTDGEFLKQIGALLCALEDEDFTAMLPQLRLTFSYFLPRETDQLAKTACTDFETLLERSAPGKREIDRLVVLKPK